MKPLVIPLAPTPPGRFDHTPGGVERVPLDFPLLVPGHPASVRLLVQAIGRGDGPALRFLPIYQVPVPHRLLLI